MPQTTTKRRLPQWMRLLTAQSPLQPSLARIDVIGSSHVMVELHHGLLELHATKVRIGLLHGELVIEGQQLEVRKMTPEELVVDGTIVSVWIQMEKKAPR